MRSSRLVLLSCACSRSSRGPRARPSRRSLPKRGLSHRAQTPRGSRYGRVPHEDALARAVVSAFHSRAVLSLDPDATTRASSGVNATHAHPPGTFVMPADVPAGSRLMQGARGRIAAAASVPPPRLKKSEVSYGDSHHPRRRLHPPATAFVTHKNNFNIQLALTGDDSCRAPPVVGFVLPKNWLQERETRDGALAMCRATNAPSRP